MDMGTIIVIIIVLAVFIGFIILFFVADSILKKGSAKAKTSKESAGSAPIKTDGDANTKASQEGAIIIDDSNLASEIESLIAKEPPKKTEEHETAASRSSMYKRRERMMQNYEKKYKARSEVFYNDSFDTHLDNSSSVMIEGVEITQDDIKKLTALQGLLALKNFDDE